MAINKGSQTYQFCQSRMDGAAMPKSFKAAPEAYGCPIVHDGVVSNCEQTPQDFFFQNYLAGFVPKYCPEVKKQSSLTVFCCQFFRSAKPPRKK